ncbi:MAG: xanthine phosphoribosyltransferase [Tepidibacter sp.]|jgi:xanthine phosphoribosyltransferase|uniref:xanthine phosphoribosyltransferase n=1 Tax=Tepidibacter sp. TaxID=2529387 RepID=UPI0025EF5FDF|nr:xanthine phosphoribosyltransferase [Tepidibacter sp.]MCT4509638.1 xanthine phosphoribosyltransferase [Tepidibacter sp.]
MKLLKDVIVKKGKVRGADILKVDSFLNHQLDINLLNEMGKEFKSRFKDDNITKILTIEASGIAIAAIAAQYFDVPVVFAKKVQSKNVDNDNAYESQVYSFTKDKTYTIRVCKDYLNASDNILILDDFLANAQAALGLKDLVKQSGANLAGIGIAIEKGFQGGGKILRDKGVKVESLAIINSMNSKGIDFE